MRIEATPALSEHLDDADAPFVDIGGGSLLRVLQVRQVEGLSIELAPGSMTTLRVGAFIVR